MQLRAFHPMRGDDDDDYDDYDGDDDDGEVKMVMIVMIVMESYHIGDISYTHASYRRFCGQRPLDQPTSSCIVSS
jgi:hypothetical protein